MVFGIRYCFVLLIALSILPGCARSKAPQATEDSTPVAASEVSEEQQAMEANPLLYRPPAPVERDPETLVATGSLPLAHLFDAGGSIRIVNATKKVVVHRQTVPPGTVLGLSRSGLVIGRQRVLSGPLPEEDRYEIWWDVRER
jgi:hypothetical protein